VAKLYFYYAAMNAGKSTTLIQADFNYRERGMETMLWTAAHDDRSGAYSGPFPTLRHATSRSSIHFRCDRLRLITDSGSPDAALD